MFAKQKQEVRALRTILIFWAPALAWFVVIYNLSAIHGSDLPKIGIPYADKIIHIMEYFVLGALLARAIGRSMRLDLEERDAIAGTMKVGLAISVFSAIILSLCYGALDEAHQLSVPGRSCDIFDLFADAVGAITGVMLYAVETAKRRVFPCHK